MIQNESLRDVNLLRADIRGADGVKNLEQYRGCLIGGAAGDALGYAVEFPGTDAVVKKYGKSGSKNCELHNGIAPVSSVTQMTLFTANGLLLGTTRGMTRGIMGPISGLHRCVL